MWRAYVRFLDWMMPKEDPEDPFSWRSVSPEELAEATIILFFFSLLMYSWGAFTYGY